MAATIEGTKRYFSRHHTPTSTLGRTVFQVSQVGFGGYRVSDDHAEHRQSLELALTSGCNLIDTSSNYTDGGSERLVGQVLLNLFSAGKLARDEIVVVTKAGYVQGENMLIARDRLENGKPFSEMVEYDDHCWHCISPEFLEDQINRSLERLKLDRIDVLLLHNPEYYLKTEGSHHEEYYRRIKKAFDYLESEVKRGRIQYYGVSSNSFPEPKDATEFTSLETLLELAAQVSAKNHFAVIQFPLNLFEPGAALEKNNSEKTVCELAQQNGLGTLVNRPLNAFNGQKMIRLADFPSHKGENTVEGFRSALTVALEVEGRYPAKKEMPIDRVAWGHILNSNIEKIRDFDSWKQIRRYQIEPTLDSALAELESVDAYRAWAQEYRPVATRLFDSFSAYFEWRDSQESQQLATKLNTACEALTSSPTLSQKVVRLYLSIPGIDVVLVGMRQANYVKDVLSLQPKVDAVQALATLKLF